MESHFIAESDNKRNFYGVWWGWEEKKAYQEKPSTGIFEHREPKHSIPFGSDTIDGGKQEKEATRSPILASEKHNVSLFHLVGSSDFSETFFCLFENAVHFFFLFSSRSAESLRQATNVSRNYSRKQKHEECFSSRISSSRLGRRARAKKKSENAFAEHSQARLSAFLLARQSLRES